MTESCDIPGQFPGTSLLLLAVRGGLRDPMPAPASCALTVMLEDRDEFIRRVAAALWSDYTRDILDGASAAAMLGTYGEVLIPVFEKIVEDCKQEHIWDVIEPLQGCTLESTLCVIRIDILIAIKAISALHGLPLALQALADEDYCYHTFAIDVIKAIGPAATDAVPNLVGYIYSNEPAGLPVDHHQYRRDLRHEACEALGAIGSVEAFAGLQRIVADSIVPVDVRDAAIRAKDQSFD